jgi:hypothetical protein
MSKEDRERKSQNNRPYFEQYVWIETYYKYYQNSSYFSYTEI